MGFEQTADGITAHLIKRVGDKETHEDVFAEWLVGAEGAKSVTRKQLGLTFEGETREADRLLIADVEVYGIGAEVRLLEFEILTS